MGLQHFAAPLPAPLKHTHTHSHGPLSCTAPSCVDAPCTPDNGLPLPTPPTDQQILFPAQFHDSKIQFPLTRKVVRPSKPELKTTYKAKRPCVAMF